MSNESIPASGKALSLHDWTPYIVKEETALLRIDFELSKYVNSSQFILLFVFVKKESIISESFIDSIWNIYWDPNFIKAVPPLLYVTNKH